LVADRIIPLNPGPRATLGPAFTVELSRPRDRRAMNHDAGYKALRREITGYLIEAGSQERQEAGPPPELPPMLPVTAHAMAPIGTIHHEQVLATELERYVELSNVSKIYPTRAGNVKVV